MNLPTIDYSSIRDRVVLSYSIFNIAALPLAPNTPYNNYANFQLLTDARNSYRSLEL